MKNLFKLLIGLVAAATISAHCATVSLSLPFGTMAAPVGLSNAIGVLNWVSITAPAANTANLQIVDTWTNQFRWTNASFISVTTYATNCITTWTNYYGRT